jgi:hypothetical protein
MSATPIKIIEPIYYRMSHESISAAR